MVVAAAPIVVEAHPARAETPLDAHISTWGPPIWSADQASEPPIQSASSGLSLSVFASLHARRTV